MYLNELAKRNKDEAFINGFFNLSLVVLLLLPLMFLLMLIHANERIQWMSPENPSQQNSVSTQKIFSGEGLFNLVTVSPSYMDKVPFQQKSDLFNCAVGIGESAPVQFIEYADSMNCTSTLKESALPDSKSVSVVIEAAENMDSTTAPMTSPESGMDSTLQYLMLVYFIVIAIPCLVCFWNISKLFDSKWVETARILSLRGANKGIAALLLSAAPLAGLLISLILSIVPLYLVSLVIQRIVWMGTAFIHEDAISGLVGTLGCAALLTVITGVFIYMRRMKLYAKA